MQCKISRQNLKTQITRHFFFFPGNNIHLFWWSHFCYYTGWLVVTFYLLHFKMWYVGSDVALTVWQVPLPQLLQCFHHPQGDIFWYMNSAMLDFPISTRLRVFCTAAWSITTFHTESKFIISTMIKESINACWILLLIVTVVHSALFVVWLVIPKIRTTVETTN